MAKQMDGGDGIISSARSYKWRIVNGEKQRSGAKAA